MGVVYDGVDQINLSPTADLPVLIQSPDDLIQSVSMRWWLTPSWSAGPSTKYAMFNARAESASQSPALKGPYRERRCLIPVSAYYEWTSVAGQKIPTLIKPKHEDGIFLGGLWDRWEKDGLTVLSFTILTTQASDGLRRIHARQPVILSKSEALDWLDTNIGTRDLEFLLQPRLPVALELVPVSTVVNKSTNQTRECMEPVGESASLEIDTQGGQIH